MQRHDFTLDTRVATALRARPELRELLPAFHPAFEKLRHPVLGRVLPKLVTVEGAARVAGVDPGALLQVFNSVGLAEEAEALARRSAEGVGGIDGRRQDPEPAWLRGADIAELDVRPTLDRGEEPFGEIMGALRQLPAGGVLRVRAPFEPAPLLDLLGTRGWEHHVCWDGDGEDAACLASFWRPPVSDDAELTGASTEVDPGDRLEGDTLDVRGLEPPMPLRMVLGTLDARGPDELPLLVVHHREPALLYPRLEERGLRWRTERLDDRVEVRIEPA